MCVKNGRPRRNQPNWNHAERQFFQISFDIANWMLSIETSRHIPLLFPEHINPFIAQRLLQVNLDTSQCSISRCTTQFVKWKKHKRDEYSVGSLVGKSVRHFSLSLGIMKAVRERLRALHPTTKIPC